MRAPDGRTETKKTKTRMPHPEERNCSPFLPLHREAVESWLQKAPRNGRPLEDVTDGEDAEE